MVQRAHDLVLYREAYTQQLRLGAYYVDSKLKVRKHRRIKVLLYVTLLTHLFCDDKVTIVLHYTLD